MARVSLQQIADRVQVSRATVSKVINNHPGVAQHTRRKILLCLQESGYKKVDRELLQIHGLEGASKVARGDIAVVVTDPQFSPFWLQIINGIAHFLDQQERHLVYHFLARGEEQQHKIPQQLHSGKLAGFIALNIYDNQTIAKLLALQVPCVFLDTSPEWARRGLQGDLLLLEGYRTIYAMTENLIAQGCRQLGFVGDIVYAESIRHRWSGFERCMQTHNLHLRPEYCLIQEPQSHFYAQASLEQALQALAQQPQAWVCANDYIACLTVQFLRRQGLAVPGTLAVTGFDNLSNQVMHTVPLTTASIHTEYIGCRLASQLLLRLQFPKMPFEVVHIEPEILWRESSQLSAV